MNNGRLPASDDSRSVFALVLGILSLVCFGIFAGIPAIVIGVMVQRDRKHAGFASSGVATSAIVTGVLGTLGSIAMFVLFFAGAIFARSAARSLPHVTTPPYPPPVVALDAGHDASTTTSYGAIVVVDLHGEWLDRMLADAQAQAVTDGRTLLVETVAATCATCKQIDLDLYDAKVQAALKNVTLVRVDVDEFAKELGGVRLAPEPVPSFYRVGPLGVAVDGITSDEWDDNVPENVAPILEKFARGALKKRRHAAPLSDAGRAPSDATRE